MDRFYKYNGIIYVEPTVAVLQHGSLSTLEIAGRTAYDSFSKSEHEQVREFDGKPVEEIEHSALVDSLCHTTFHHSVIEHTSITFNVSNIGRGVLQELARHRIASYTVRSTRYTMAPILNAFAVFILSSREDGKEQFISTVIDMDMFVIQNNPLRLIIAEGIFDKLHAHLRLLGDQDFLKLCLSKSVLKSINTIQESPGYTNYDIENTIVLGKMKRNAGDSFKYIVDDNWKTDLVMTFNLRSLKNLIELRNSGAAWFQIKHLAREVEAAIPEKFLRLLLPRTEDCLK